MWTILNSTSASVVVNDIAIPQTIAPYGTASFYVSDVLASRVLGENIANGSLCVTTYGSFAASDEFLPVSFPVHPLNTETQSGAGNPLTLGVFAQGMLLLNVTALTQGSSLAIGFQPFDGTAYYPPVSAIASVTATGPVDASFATVAGAGRFTWTVAGSVTFSLIAQMQMR